MVPDHDTDHDCDRFEIFQDLNFRYFNKSGDILYQKVLNELRKGIT